MTDVIVSALIPPAMAEAILAAQGAMPSLRKEDVNNYGGYTYVSIDEYLDVVPKIAAQFGLFWITRETDYQVVGEKHNHIAYTFELDLFHKDGTCLPKYGRITVVHPIQGAQTAGSALAYGEKMLTRFLFKIVTGEKDADASDNSKVVSLKTADPTPAPKVPAAKPVLTTGPKVPMGEIIGGIAAGGVKVTENDGVPIIEAPTDPLKWDVASAVFLTFVPQCTSARELKDFWNENTGALDKMKVQAPDIYKKVHEAFTAHQSTLKKGA